MENKLTPYNGEIVKQVELAINITNKIININQKKGLTNQEYMEAFQLLKDNLFNNLAIYHERVTLLIQLTNFDILESRVNFKAKIIKPLNKKYAEANRLYQHMITNDLISFSSSYQMGNMDDSQLLLNGNKVARAYCPFILWLDPELAQFILQNEDELTSQIPNYILRDKDWRIIKR